MPKPQNFTSDDSETYTTVIKPMVDKIAKVARAFKMPFIFVAQPVTGEDMDTAEGQMYIPPHTSNNVGVAAYILNSRDDDDLKLRIMRMATNIAMAEVGREGKQQMKELFSVLEPGADRDPDKPLN